jgi:hypothetical protein
MDIQSIARKNSAIQQQACRNLFDALDILQDYAEQTSWYWAGQVGIEKPVKAALDPYLRASRSGRRNARQLLREGFAGSAAWLAGNAAETTS